MSRLTLINASCVDQNADAVVNAANNCLLAGSGICGEIFSRAGRMELHEACRAYEIPLADGSAVITPAFGIKNAKYIIHAVGPNFARTPDATDVLCDAYYNSFKVLMENGLHSIAFPLISAGKFGGDLDNPVAESTKQCFRAYDKFTSEYPDYDVDVKLCAYTYAEMLDAQYVLSKMI